MKVQNGLFCLLSTFLTISSSWAGSDTITCANRSNTIHFAVGNADHRITMILTDTNTGSKSTYTTDVKLMPHYDYNNVDSNADQLVAALPAGTRVNQSSSFQERVVIGKDGKVRCSGRQIQTATYRQTMVLTQRNFNRENQSFNRSVFQGKTIEGYDSSTGFITAEFICRHSSISSAGGCYAEVGETETTVGQR